MNWDAVSAIGTVLAAIVGLSRIIINDFEKKKLLIMKLVLVPETWIFVSNASSRSVTI